MPRPLYISSIKLKNIKCFTNVELDIWQGDASPGWSVMVGDNAVGKTALLKSIALGLCDESSAAGLMKESDEGYIKRDSQAPGEIIINLIDPDNKSTQYQIATRIEKIKLDENSYERLRQETIPETEFPWDRIFACAYGMGRAAGGTGDISGYSVINAVYNLFSYGEGLQNPELTILRIEKEDNRNKWLKQIAQVMNIPSSAIHLRKYGITIDGNGRWEDDMPLRDLADGYRATFLWVADFVGWALAFNEGVQDSTEITGIVLIDELEQHLHATWQRRIVEKLREQFPFVQFFTTTHSPFIASSIGPHGSGNINDQLILCESDKEIKDVNVEKIETMQTYRVEQVLASRAFKYLVESTSLDLENELSRASYLIDKGKDRTSDEDDEYKALKDKFKDPMFLKARSSIERKNEDDEIKRVKDLEKQLKEKKERSDDHDK